MYYFLWASLKIVIYYLPTVLFPLSTTVYANVFKCGQVAQLLSEEGSATIMRGTTNIVARYEKGILKNFFKENVTKDTEWGRIEQPVIDSIESTR